MVPAPPSRIILLLLLLSAFVGGSARATLFTTVAKKTCGHGISVMSAIATFPFSRGGAAFDVGVQGLLNLNGMGNPLLYRHAIGRRLRGQTALNFEWAQGPLGQETVLTARDLSNPLSLFVKDLTDSGVTVVWGLLPAYNNAMYLPSERRLYIHHLDLATLRPSHYSLHEADHATIQTLRLSGKYTGPIFTLLYEAQGFHRGKAKVTILEPTEELWTYPRAFNNLLENSELDKFTRRQGLLEMLPGWNLLLSRLKWRAEQLLKYRQESLDSELSDHTTAESLWGASPLKWIGLSHGSSIAEIPTRIPTTPNARRIFFDGHRRLLAVQQLVNEMTALQLIFEPLLIEGKPGYEAAAKVVVLKMIRLAEINFYDETDPQP